MANLKLSVSNVYQRTYEAEQWTKIICEEGGSRSSKTWSIFQRLIMRAIQGEKLTYTIARKNLSWIKSTLLRDFDAIIKKEGLKVYPSINYNRPEQIYKLNGTEFGFFGLDYTEKLHGRTQDIFWLNEVMEISKADFDQLEMRTNLLGIVDYNPYDDLHWVFDLQKRSDVALIRSTMLDNPFLPATIRKKIMGYKPTPENIAQGTADAYMWEVYGLGNKARLQGAVFNNWDIVEDLPRDPNGNILATLKGLGLDYGYTNDPTAVIELYLYNNEIYLNELIYEKGLLNPDIAERLRNLEVHRTTPIYGDSAEPKSNEEIRRYGFNIYDVEKGADSINFGLDLLKSYKIHITKKSINLENEFRKYKYMEDKSGKMLNRPIDDFNHGIDASRYIAISTLRKVGKIEILDRRKFGI